MILEDSKLLVDVAYHERHGQLGLTVELGFDAAKERLIRAGALICDPTCRSHVTITGAGKAFVEALIDRLGRAAFVQEALKKAGFGE